MRSWRDKAGSSCFSTARRTWWKVHPGFFSQLLSFSGQEQKADHAQDQVSHQRPIASDLEVAHADLALAVLEDAFDMPAAESNVQQDLEGRVAGRIGKEVLHLTR